MLQREEGGLARGETERERGGERERKTLSGRDWPLAFSSTSALPHAPLQNKHAGRSAHSR